MAEIDAALARVASLPCWSGRVAARPLSGGITNQNFVVDDGPRRYVVRLGGDIPVHGILRSNELAASRAAEAAGISPAVIHAEPGALVIDFIEGRTFTPEDVRAPENLPRLVDLVRRAHREVPKHLRGPAPLFWVFHVVRDYLHTLAEAETAHRDDLPGLARIGEELEARIGPIELAFGHNDLLAANFIDAGDRLWLVDWDYAGFNSPLFDLGGLASNSDLAEPARLALLEAYYGRPPDDRLLAAAAAMTAASLLRETLWSMVSEVYSRLDFDYAAYTAENRARLTAALARLPEPVRP